MTIPPTHDDVVRFRALLAERMGLHFDDSKSTALARALNERVVLSGAGYREYLDQLASEQGGLGELALLAQELTVTETYFLRNADQFTALINVALPERLAASNDRPCVQILSFGCASGEEPYSLAIAIRESLPDRAARVTITAADINPAALEKARRARYSPWSLRDVPAAIQARWFQQDGSAFILDKEITTAVRFEQRNLAQDDPGFWQAGRFDIVFCRNLLMYFTPEQAQAAVKRIAAAMVPGGYLFLGHAETLRGISNDFHVCHTNDAFYYRRDEQVRPADPLLPPTRAERWQPAPLNDSSWIETIQRAAERIQALTCLPAVAMAGHAAAHRPAPDLAPAFEFLHRERFEQALAHLDSLPADHAGDPDVLLLRAVLLSHSGTLDKAEAACQSLLQDDELNAGAHYVLALCREGLGDLAGALEQNQIAAYLDPDFAMPRLHLGLLARRRGERATAERELVRAQRLLQKEDASRLLLFGGGFKREALMALCQAELAKLGARG